jgi:K+-sensing histidine kinase KdpD
MLIGRSHQAGWRRLLGRTADIRLVREAEDMDVQVVALGEARE